MREHTRTHFIQTQFINRALWHTVCVKDLGIPAGESVWSNYTQLMTLTSTPFHWTTKTNALLNKTLAKKRCLLYGLRLHASASLSVNRANGSTIDAESVGVCPGCGRARACQILLSSVVRTFRPAHTHTHTCQVCKKRMRGKLLVFFV